MVYSSKQMVLYIRAHCITEPSYGLSLDHGRTGLEKYTGVVAGNEGFIGGSGLVAVWFTLQSSKSYTLGPPT